MTDTLVSVLTLGVRSTVQRRDFLFFFVLSWTELPINLRSLLDEVPFTTLTVRPTGRRRVGTERPSELDRGT